MTLKEKIENRMIEIDTHLELEKISGKDYIDKITAMYIQEKKTLEWVLSEL